MNSVVVKGELDSLVLEVSGYENEHAADASDANWLVSKICLEVHPFRGSFAAALSTHDFLAFSKSLNALLDGESTCTSFSTDEGWISFTIEVDALGRGEVAGEAFAGTQARLLFRFETDFTSLRRCKKEVDQLLKAFPVKAASNRLF